MGKTLALMLAKTALYSFGIFTINTLGFKTPFYPQTIAGTLIQAQISTTLDIGQK
jgi:hypothetical protein